MKEIKNRNVDLETQDNPYRENSRDSDGTCCKVTWALVGKGEDKKELMVYKDPKTDSGKKSLKGLFSVQKDKDGSLYVIDGLNTSQLEEFNSEFETVFENGNITKIQTLEEIRNRITKELL